MKRLFVFLFIAAAAVAQPALTPIQDMLYDQFGNLYSGSLSIALNTKSASASGSSVLSVVKTLWVTNGALNVSLVPNSAITPGSTSYLFSFANGGRKICTIPASSTPIKLASYCSDNPPSGPSASLPWGQITGLISNQADLEAALAAITWNSLSGKPSTFTPSAHASTHAAGGSDPLTPTAIFGAAPNAPGGAVTQGSDGSVPAPAVILGPYVIQPAAGKTTLPAASSANQGYVTRVIDGATAADCSIGGGSNEVSCWNPGGSGWTAFGSGGTVYNAGTGILVTCPGSTCTIGIDPAYTGVTGPGYGGTSTSAVTIGSGTLTFTTQSGLAWNPGAWISATAVANTDYVVGTVSSYSGTTLTISVSTSAPCSAGCVVGSGSFSSWVFASSGPPGPQGPTGFGISSLSTQNGVRSVGGSPITSTGTIEEEKLVNAQTGTSYTVADGDRAKLVTLCNTAPVAVTLPQAGSGGNFIAGWLVNVTNECGGDATITPTTSTIDGKANIVLRQHDSIQLISDGTNYESAGKVLGLDCMDEANFCLFEDFVPNASFGLYRWFQQSGTMNSATDGSSATVEHPGITSLTTAAAPNSTAAMALSFSSALLFHDLSGTELLPWYSAGSVLYDNGSGIFPASQGGTYFGFVNGTGSPLSAVPVTILIGADTVAPTGFTCSTGTWSTVDWNFVTASGASTATCVDSGIAMDSGTWYKLKMWSTVAGTISFQVGSSSISTISTNVPTVAFSPEFETTTRALSSAKIGWVDFFKFRGAGLTR